MSKVEGGGGGGLPIDFPLKCSCNFFLSSRLLGLIGSVILVALTLQILDKKALWEINIDFAALSIRGLNIIKPIKFLLIANQSK